VVLVPELGLTPPLVAVQLIVSLGNPPVAEKPCVAP
jgi:hypothetical protein